MMYIMKCSIAFMAVLCLVYPLFCGFWKARKDTANTAEITAKVINKKAQNGLNKIK